MERVVGFFVGQLDEHGSYRCPQRRGGTVYLAGFRITRSSQFRNGDDAGSEQIKRGANKQHFVLLLRREYQN